jgi:hypothetical protein
MRPGRGRAHRGGQREPRRRGDQDTSRHQRDRRGSCVRETHEDALPVLFVAAAERLIQYGAARQAWLRLPRALRLHSTLGAPRRATRRTYPVDGNVITPRSRAGDRFACPTTAQTVHGRLRGGGCAQPRRQWCMLTVTLLIHSVLLPGRRAASSEADVCEEFNGGSGSSSAAGTCGWRDAGETQSGAWGSKGNAAGSDYST